MLNLRKKLLVSIFTLMLALVAVSTTTYAWFTLGTEVNVDGISMEVEGSDGLYIRVVSINGETAELGDLTTFQSSLHLDEVLQYHKNKVQNPLKLSPLTYNVEKSYLSEIAASATGWAPSTTGKTTASGQYLHIEFELSSASQLDIYFDHLETSSNETAISFPTSVALDERTHTPISGLFDELGEKVANPASHTVSAVKEGGSVTAARLANALRMAYSGYPANKVETADDGSTKRTYAYTENEKSYSEFSEILSKNIICPDDYDMSSEQYGYWLGASSEYFNEISDLPLENVPSEYKYVNVTYATQEDVEAGNATVVDEVIGYNEVEEELVVTLAGDDDHGYYATITITIWLEGYDSDCFNAILKDDVNVVLSFVGEKHN